MRIALLGALVDVGEDAESQLRILVQDLALGPVVAEVGGDERLVLEDFLQQRAHLLPPRAGGVFGEDAMTGGRESFERVAHGGAPSRQRASPNFWNVCVPSGASPRLTAKVHVTSLT